ncbi:MAG: YbaN family protein [Candidatus Wallacebacter cryptica]
MSRKFKKILYISLGLIFTALGSLGVVLPVLPTTPFLLLASFFFTRGSDRFNQWFASTKLYQNHLADFMRERSMKLSTKIKLLALASSMMLISGLTVEILPFKVFIGFMLVYLYYYFIFRIKTI